MDSIEELSRSKFFLLLAGGYGFLLIVGWLFRLSSQKFIFSEVVLMQTSPWRWSWFYNVSFLACLWMQVVASICFSIVIFVLYLLVR